MRLLADRVAVITGAASGIGERMATTFAAQGCKVVIADIDEEAALTTAARINATWPKSALGVRCDVADESAVMATARFADREFGSLHIWVNNAGFIRDALMHKMSLDDFASVVRVHLIGAWLGVKAAGAIMRDSGQGGSVINMSSISGKVGNPGQTNYSAAKAGMIGLTKSAAKELARYGVRVNALQPGLIATPMTEAMPTEVLADRLKEIPLGRIGSTQDVANVALFLASDLSAYMTGTVLEVTGGRHM